MCRAPPLRAPVSRGALFGIRQHCSVQNVDVLHIEGWIVGVVAGTTVPSVTYNESFLHCHH